MYLSLVFPFVSLVACTAAFQSAPSVTSVIVTPSSNRLSSTHPTCTHISNRQSCALSLSGSGFGKRISNSTPSSTTSKSKSASSSLELFELQELRAQLQTIVKENILYQSLSPEKREELTKYVKAVLDKTDSPIDFSGKSGSTMGSAQFVAGIENKSWRMVFSTDTTKERGRNDTSGGDGSAELPYGSTVVFRVGEFQGTDGSLDYVLKFSKQVMGLKELVAKSTCSVGVSGWCVLSMGMVTFEILDV